jgi:phage antirepressor YoqD-like protein
MERDMSDFLPFDDQIEKVSVPGVKTMDSRDIAELTGKQHAHVCRDIQDMFERLGINQSIFGSVYLAGNGENRRCFKLPYRETMILVSGYSVELRAKVIDRWMELERKESALPDFTNPVAAARAWADQTEAKIKAETALALAAPKVEMAEALMRCDRNMCITDACKHFGLHPKTEVFPYLRHHGYLTTRDLPTQAAIDAGYLELKETVLRDGSTIAQAVVAVWQLENWRSHVVHQVKRWCGEMAV